MPLTGRTGSAQSGFPSAHELLGCEAGRDRELLPGGDHCGVRGGIASPRLILQFASGDAGNILVQQSQDARLLVVGTREHAGLGRLLSGSVSHYCLSHAVCPSLRCRPLLLSAVRGILTRSGSRHPRESISMCRT